jgi:hypothetical protein
MNKNPLKEFFTTPQSVDFSMLFVGACLNLKRFAPEELFSLVEEKMKHEGSGETDIEADI